MVRCTAKRKGLQPSWSDADLHDFILAPVGSSCASPGSSGPLGESQPVASPQSLPTLNDRQPGVSGAAPPPRPALNVSLSADISPQLQQYVILLFQDLSASLCQSMVPPPAQQVAPQEVPDTASESHSAWLPSPLAALVGTSSTLPQSPVPASGWSVWYAVDASPVSGVLDADDGSEEVLSAEVSLIPPDWQVLEEDGRWCYIRKTLWLPTY